MEHGPTMSRNRESFPLSMLRMISRDSAMNVACLSERLISLIMSAGDGSGMFFVMCRSETCMMFFRSDLLRYG